MTRLEVHVDFTVLRYFCSLIVCTHTMSQFGHNTFCWRYTFSLLTISALDIFMEYQWSSKISVVPIQSPANWLIYIVGHAHAYY